MGKRRDGGARQPAGETALAPRRTTFEGSRLLGSFEGEHVPTHVNVTVVPTLQYVAPILTAVCPVVRVPENVQAPNLYLPGTV